MSEVVQLDDHRLHRAGWACCAICGRRWVAVAPVAVVKLECPSCNRVEGLFE